MTHLPFIVACYALGVGVPLVFGVGAWLRLGVATRRLRTLDPREGR